MSAKIKTMDFAFNWNNKLNCRAFVEVRQGEDWAAGEPCLIRLAGKTMGVARVESVRTITLSDVSEMLAALAYGCTETAARAQVEKVIEHGRKTYPLQLLLIKYDERFQK